jgi:hypothetical protein
MILIKMNSLKILCPRNFRAKNTKRIALKVNRTLPADEKIPALNEDEITW